MCSKIFEARIKILLKESSKKKKKKFEKVYVKQANGDTMEVKHLARF